ncbi:hypothetical protein PALS2_100 [Staphylococcus phage PALS_2]|nr:hypothetical protein PALS2_100 [Staphylococcus phage PALS_2]
MKNLVLKSAVGFAAGIVLGLVSNKIDAYTLAKIEEKEVLDKADSIINN